MEVHSGPLNPRLAIVALFYRILWILKTVVSSYLKPVPEPGAYALTPVASCSQPLPYSPPLSVRDRFFRSREQQGKSCQKAGCYPDAEDLSFLALRTWT